MAKKHNKKKQGKKNLKSQQKAVVHSSALPKEAAAEKQLSEVQAASEAEQVNVSDAETLVEVEAVEQAKPELESAPEPVIAAVEAEPAAEPAPQPVAAVEAEPAAEPAPQPVAAVEDKPVAEPATQPVAEAKPAVVKPKPNKPKPKVKMPSWLQPAAPAAPARSEIATPVEEAKPEAATPQAPTSEPEPAPAPEPAPKASEPAFDADGMLLGAPIPAGDDVADDLLTPAEIVETKPVIESNPLAGVVGGFMAPLGLEKKAKKEDQVAKPEVRESAPASANKLKDEITYLNDIVNAVESLDYLKPRMKRIMLTGCEMGDLVGLYRIVSQVLLENLRKTVESARKMRDRYEKRLADVVMEKSAEFVDMVQRGTIPSRAERKEATECEGKAAIMLRKQLEIKDELLMKAREEAAAADARYEKIQNDVKNIRQRQEKDLAIQLQKAREGLFNNILPTLDSFDSALAASDSFVQVSDVVDGLRNIHHQLLDACASEGLQPIETKEQPFDPNLHEAVGYVTTDEVPEDCVYKETRRGYMLNEKLLRASMVQIARKP